MKTVHENPTVLQSYWGESERGRECFLVTAVLRDGKPMLYTANVVPVDETEEAEAVEVKSRLQDLLEDASKYEPSNPRTTQ